MGCPIREQSSASCIPSVETMMFISVVSMKGIALSVQSISLLGILWANKQAKPTSIENYMEYFVLICVL